MDKSKYADIALILTLLSLVSPILAILASQGIIPNFAIYAGLAVSGTGLMGLILGFLGYKETEHKWRSIAAIIISIAGLIIDLIFSFGVIVDLTQELMSDLSP